MKSCFTISALFFTSALIAQHTVHIEVSQVPAYHVSGSDIYIAGSFNGWNPKDSNFRFKRNEEGKYFIDLKLEDGSYEYKITGGGWNKVECDENGVPTGNRKLEIPNERIDISIKGWADRFPSKPRTSTASANVKVIDTSFLIPQLNRTRRIWIYLPADYSSQPKKRYPVLYMQDGQNIFDDLTSFSGEWGVDEFLDTTKAGSSIVVAIDHGNSKRINEYSPYNTERYGKGEGDAYVDFLVKTLKPYIDKHFRTLKDKAHTAIAGSSMGGLISMYAVLKYPTVYGKVGVFSPSFWLGGEKLYSAMKSGGKKVNSLIYFYGGKLEGEEIVKDLLRAYETMSKVSKSKMVTVIRDEGRHNELTWRKEFPLFYNWK